MTVDDMHAQAERHSRLGTSGIGDPDYYKKCLERIEAKLGEREMDSRPQRLARACVKVDHQFPTIHIVGSAAVYDLDDGIRHVDITQMFWNGSPVDYAGCLPKVQRQIRELFIEQAAREVEHVDT